MLITRYIALVLLGILVWGNMYTMMGTAAGPEGQLFKIGVLAVAAYLCGCIVNFFTLPSLLGMLLMGVLLRNIGFIELTGHYLDVAADLRKVALVIILIRAGLGLDPEALKRLTGMIVRLSVIPSVAETFVVAVTSHFLLELPWLWSILLGSVMAAVSPAVVVPCLFSLQDRGYGRSKGIPTLVIAAASFDDIISVSVFGVMLSILSPIFHNRNLTMTILRGPIGVLIGMIFGTCLGMLLWFVPERNDRFVVTLRTILLGGGGVLALFASEAFGYDGAGPLSCVNPVVDNFAAFWTIFQPILFGLIGTEINLYFLDIQTVQLGGACLVISLLSRVLVSVCVAAGGNLNWKEKIFVAWAWFPKATVQAAIGPVALDIAREMESEEDEVYARKVLIVAVLAILITAPIGAILINILGPRLLQQESSFSLEMPKLRQSSENPQDVT
ncbi:hypothetical protein L9F63_013137 [Diploptera punctata]|uniref:Cation/H+ exchanger transmembrane domain-containing protein n=1 Tax=Diploptera punctata TaxID=6984 RepID=A0AAD8AAS9_DIPPU|nr:hypothetical protein L9F63_013137 [Diploptera punctata]